ncbi:sn-glycerol-3-phosphate ABC transporter ATP-binding protein UgpC [Conexibacter stalactiti]|uniref:Sn-glycerol-3-phosphate ABC transporter ATP-binding protein UgpC n=1 Tax=Conexibacter stalactiti TaxID=1940611 RepID=A0ABU4HS50_9ACTN|nr:sn-glycerol-3-phosphate ABC transporter ATP-binding protein UgpC [Conexibacter stalactiti]MDW5596140.1 sn-glycerol-3-phosphate ABC transporter ATP-binding protein UgpC [Conexibacter stalactiti]MEC5036782.1 sn-glycerol-3-phosphate ABC transporter ATP-binding protein UgpC [Conexibacter stalactiti]
MGAIEIDAVSKVYDGGVCAVDAVELEVADGEFMVLVGPSGCGKSTLLRMIAGLEEVTHGAIRIGGRDVTRLQPPDRDIAMVFQNYALYPHMTVAENLAFGLRQRRTPKEEVARRVDEVSGMLGLEELMARKPVALSGGQRQRVAMGRALVREPAAFLMDEPLSNLDAKLRASMRGQLARLHERVGTTTVYVTHDQVEAMTLGQRVAVMRGGVLQQCDVPQELFRRPVNLFVAAFIGSPSMNLADAVVGDGVVRFGEHAIALPEGYGLAGSDGAERRVVLGIRPTDLELAGPSVDPSWPRIAVTVEAVEELGAETHAIFALEAPRVTAEAVQEAADQRDPDDGTLLADDRRARFTAAVHGRHAVRAGERIELAVDHRALHVFDPVSGDALSLGLRPRTASEDLAQGARSSSGGVA